MKSRREGWKIKHGTELDPILFHSPVLLLRETCFASHTILCDRDDEIRVTFSQWNIVVCGMSSPLDKFQPIEEILGLCAAHTSNDTQSGLRVCFGSRLCKLKNKMSSRPNDFVFNFFRKREFTFCTLCLFFMQNCHAMKLNSDHWFLRSARQEPSRQFSA